VGVVVIVLLIAHRDPDPLIARDFLLRAGLDYCAKLKGK
jgi:hypothetical protein